VEATHGRADLRLKAEFPLSSGRAALHAELDLGGGVSEAELRRFLANFRAALEPYAQAEPPAAAGKLRRVSAPVGNFAVWIDPEVWKETSPDKKDELQFATAKGEAYAKIITERIGFPLNAWHDLALTNLRNLDKEARVTAEEERMVRGQKVKMLQMEGRSGAVPFVFYGYYFGGQSGSIQLVTWTSQSLFASMEPKLRGLLDGLEINDTPVAAAPASAAGPRLREVSFNDGKIVLSYDESVWKQGEKTESGRVSFEHARGDAGALMIVERLPVALDSLKEIALSNAREADSNASITFEEKRQVNGVEVLCLRMKAVVKSIPFQYYGYYYGGPQGTVQVLTYTGESLFKEYEKDFTAFLNGLKIQ